MELNKIYQMDCIEGMKQLEDDSINLICIDPPYNIGKDKRWDKYKQDEYIAFMGEVFKECERVLKPNGSFYWFHNDIKQINNLMSVIEKETSFIYKQFIVWNKRFKGAKNKGFLDGFIEVEGLRNYQKMAEYCLFYTFQGGDFVREYYRGLLEEKGLKASDFNRFMWRNGYCRNGSNVASHIFGYNNQVHPPSDNMKMRLNEFFGVNNFERYTYNNQKTHHSVWDYEIEKKQGHITPKPIKLIENIIKHSSNEGDTVLDCFMGSGTTAVSALRTNRNYIGFERESEYIQIAQKRIEDTKELMEQGDLFTLDNI